MTGEDKVLAITSRKEQIESQISDTAERTAQYFEVLMRSGLSHEAATEMTRLFNRFLLYKHFGVEYQDEGGGINDGTFKLFGL